MDFLRFGIFSGFDKKGNWILSARRGFLGDLVDFDGNFEYSDEVYVENPGPVDYALQQNYPKLSIKIFLN